MTNEELDEFRRLLVAFEDVAAWCEQLLERAGEFIEGARQGHVPDAAGISEYLHHIDDTRRYLEDERRMVASIRARVGLPASGV